MIFISHSTRDGDLAIKLMDLLQTQFNLQRENFFLTSDEELKYGEDWIESIRVGMDEANLVLPLITPNFLGSQFCLCELGATWVNQKALVPIILPPLNHSALQETPFRSWMQSLTLNSEQDLARLAQTMVDKNVGKVNFPRFNTRAKAFYNEVLEPFKVEMESREVISEALVTQLRKELKQFKEAYDEAEKESEQLRKENEALRDMKDKEEVKAYEYSNMEDWEMFTELVRKVSSTLRKLPKVLPSVLFQSFRYDNRKSDERGLYSPSANDELKILENRGFVVWDDGWQPNEIHPQIHTAKIAIQELKKFLDTNLTEELEVRFNEEYEGLIFDMAYSDFWEKILGLIIYHSGE
ncbi:toll/interleukin-1 receptor domain-containing protein [Bacillus sp. RS11]|uniref:toll/interleukin-1 receptor domain-containing protein n=1 Tax=Lysinibacillus sp. RS11 TaxID=3242682 RepID=UPI0035C6901E